MLEWFGDSGEIHRSFTVAARYRLLNPNTLPSRARQQVVLYPKAFRSLVDARDGSVDTFAVFAELTAKLGTGKSAFILADLNDLLTDCAGELLASLPAPSIADANLANYVAAMVELTAYKRRVRPPGWTLEIPPLSEPVFAAPWQSLRAHLLTASPVSFRRRNIFIDPSIGARV